MGFPFAYVPNLSNGSNDQSGMQGYLGSMVQGNVVPTKGGAMPTLQALALSEALKRMPSANDLNTLMNTSFLGGGNT